MLRILLVDDESTERKGLKFLIDKYKLPLEVHEAANGRAALDYIYVNEIDILLTDVKMPFMNGLELARAVYEYNDKIKIIMFSAHSEFDYAKQALEAKALNYLLKPIEVDEFQAVMKMVIALCNEETEKERESLLHRESYLKMQKYDREHLLYQLVTAPEIHSDYATILEAQGICFMGGVFTLASMETHSNFFDKHENNVRALLGRFLHMPYEYINVSFGSSYVVLYGTASPNEQEIAHAFQGFRSEIHRRTGAELSVLISSPFREIERFPEKVQEIEAARTELFYREDNLLFTESLRQVRETGPASTNHIMAVIEAAIENRDTAEIKRQLHELTNTLKQQAALSAVYTRYLFCDILKSLYKKFQVQDNTFFNQRIDALLQCDSLEQIHELMEELVDGMSVQMPDASTVVESVIRIIQTEYQKDLSLEYLSQRVFLAPAYLSYLFKKQTGENIIRYITSIRMEKAKKMLQDSNMKIVDICRACGYDHASYFNRLFKNSFGMTPKLYRENPHV